MRDDLKSQLRPIAENSRTAKTKRPLAAISPRSGQMLWPHSECWCFRFPAPRKQTPRAEARGVKHDLAGRKAVPVTALVAYAQLGTAPSGASPPPTRHYKSVPATLLLQ